MAVVHLAGIAITIEGRVIQRCSVCGEKLVDSLNCASPVGPDGTVSGMPLWVTGGLVECEGNRMSLIEPEVSDDKSAFKIPENFCIILVEN